MKFPRTTPRMWYWMTHYGVSRILPAYEYPEFIVFTRDDGQNLHLNRGIRRHAGPRLDIDSARAIRFDGIEFDGPRHSYVYMMGAP